MLESSHQVEKRIGILNLGLRRVKVYLSMKGEGSHNLESSEFGV